MSRLAMGLAERAQQQEQQEHRMPINCHPITWTRPGDLINIIMARKQTADEQMKLRRQQAKQVAKGQTALWHFVGLFPLASTPQPLRS